jgi:uncharacterized protein (DUF1330 family)
MAGYVIAEIEITEPGAYEEYKKMVMPTLAAYGGRFLVRGGAAEKLEGDPDPGRIVVLEFESAARAKQWWASAEYAPAKARRQAASRGRLIVVDGA